MLFPHECCGACGERAALHAGYPKPGHINYQEHRHAAQQCTQCQGPYVQGLGPVCPDCFESEARSDDDIRLYWGTP